MTHTLDMKNPTTISRFRWLRELMPLADAENLRRWASLPLKSITVVVTTCSTSADSPRKREQCRQMYATPFFVLRFAHARNDKPADVSMTESFSYPSRLAGSLLKIRKHIEDTCFLEGGFLIISDDDPGSSYRGGAYQPKLPRAIIPQITDIGACGAQRVATTSEQLALLWHIAFYLGREQNCAYVGLNGSEQQLTALLGYETTGACPNRSFGTYGLRPIQTGVAITGAAGILQPLRKIAPRTLQDLKQEWASISAMAISEGFNTLMVMPVQATFAVKPPRDAAKDIAALARMYPGVVRQGNSAGGASDEEKTGCIIHFLTATQLEV